MKLPLAKNQGGYALLVAIMVMLVLSILGTALLSVVAGNVHTSTEEAKFQSAYYTAEAGAVYQMKVIKDNITSLHSSTTNSTDFFNAIESCITTYPKTMNTFEMEYGSQPVAEISFERLDALGSDPCTYRITSKGTVGGSTRIVAKDFDVQRVSSGLSGLMSVFSNGQMTMENGTVIGPIGTNSTAGNAVSITGNPSIQDVNLLSGAGLSAPAWWLTNWHYSKLTMASPKNYTLPAFPTFPVYGKMADAYAGTFKVINAGSVKITNYQANNYVLHLTDNTYIPVITIKSNWNLTIDVGATDKAIVVDKISLDSGHIRLTGAAKLTIYLTDSIFLSGGSRINSPTNESNVSQASEAVNKLSVYLKGANPANTLNLAGNQKIYGSLYAENANINISGGAGFQGALVTGGANVVISGGTSVVTNLFYAPNAYVYVTGGGTVNGPIIANTFKMDGGASAGYDPSAGVLSNPFGVNNGTVLSDIISMEGAIREK